MSEPGYVLNCESLDSAIESVAAAFDVKTATVRMFCASLDIEAYYESPGSFEDVDKVMLSLFEEHTDREPREPTQVSWFHLSRVREGTDYADGILPLSDARERVWDMVHGAFRGTEHEARLQQLQQDGVADFQYSLKESEPMLAGPYAMLVRDTAFAASEMGNHDYLDISETMEDICNGYRATHGVDISRLLASRLEPVVVKFTSSKRTDLKCVGAALYYIYVKIHGEEMSTYSNTCFDGKNERVPPEDIDRVEFLRA